MEENKTIPLFTKDIDSENFRKTTIRCMGCMEEFSAEYAFCPHCGYAVGTKPKNPYCLRPGINLSNRYMLGKVIGQGGFGITYIGWDKIKNRKVAIKEFFPNALSTRTEGETAVSCYNEKAESYFKEGIRKMMDEGERLSKFSNHPNIVDIRDNFEENNTAYIVMEYLDGKSLKAYAEEKGGRIPPKEAVDLMMPVLNALNAMHRQNMIHRDIAPDNIYICNDGTVKLLDFGSARIAVEDAEKSLSVMVKPGYAPREQYASRSKQGPWTDIYSACATLYRLITGEAPVESIDRDTTPLKSFASFGITGYDALENIIVKGLEPDHEKRIRDANALRTVITKTVLNGEGNSDEGSETPDKNKPKKQKEPKAKKKKKIGIIIAAVVMGLVLVASAVGLGIYFFGGQSTPTSEGEIIASGELNDSITWSINEEGLLLIEGTGDIPDFICEDKGVLVDCPWYDNSIHIKSVVIEEGITKIGGYSFSCCTELASVTISESVTSIGHNAFGGCYNLTNIKIPNSVTSIDEYAFYGCSKLEDVYYGGTEQQWSEIEISDVGNSELLNANIHFNSFGELTDSINWTLCADGLLLIEGTGDMPEIEANSQWKSFSDQIKTVIISNGISNIGDGAFVNCKNLESITIPDGVTSIGDSVFYGCSSLESITIPDSVTSIGDGAFSGCGNFKDVYYEGTGQQWNEIVFDSWNSDLLNANIHFISSATEMSTEVESTQISTEVESTQIKGKRVLSSGKLTDSINWTLYEDGLLSINGRGDMPEVKANSQWRSFSDEIKTVIISNGITNVGPAAFRFCANITDVTIPNGVTSIGNAAFSHCESLESITVPNSVTSIDVAAFYYCGSLKSITLSDGVTSIDTNTFYGCKSLKSITIPNSVISIGNGAFSNCISLESITIPDSVTTIGEDAFSSCRSLKSITIPDSVTSIGEDAFSLCTRLEHVTISDGVTSIGEHAFTDCINLKSITIPDSVTSICEYAFSDCDNLTDVFYRGTEEQWNEITISDTGNSDLLNANIHYNS